MAFRYQNRKNKIPAAWGTKAQFSRSNSRTDVLRLLQINFSRNEVNMITKLSHANLLVRDQKQAYDVYVNKLGFRVHTDMTMDNGFRWLTICPPSQPDLEIVVSEPIEPMFEADLIPHVRALLD